jgi:hypothetical protein
MLSTFGSGPGQGMMSPSQGSTGWARCAEFWKPLARRMPIIRWAVAAAGITPPLSRTAKPLLSVPAAMIGAPGSLRLAQINRPSST